MASHNSRSNRGSSDLLDLSFVTEWSDDEGIGSDVSLENSEQSSSSGTLNTSDNTLSRRQESKPQVKFPPKRSISVKRFVRILRKSVSVAGASEGASQPESQPVQQVSECQLPSQKVFGVDLSEHLEQTSCLVPRIVEFCCDIIEESGLTDGVYRLSGQSSHIVTLKRQFEGGKVPDKVQNNNTDVHAVASLLKVSNKTLFTLGTNIFSNSKIRITQACNLYIFLYPEAAD